jgi:hypothetical protein
MKKSKKLNHKPALPILHHMARSGGTIISRCLSSMDNIALLSEIHPFGYQSQQSLNPLMQAHEWFNLLTQSDIDHVMKKHPYPFVDAIRLIKKRCDERGLSLVIRDWSHIDFTGWPHNPSPSYELTTAKVLSKKFRIINTASVRHPIDQWLSFKESQSWAKTEFSLEQFLHGYQKFAERAQKIGFIRYEDFVDSPETIMEQLCNNLELPFDAAFQEKWAQNSSVTTAVRKRDGGFNISRRPRPYVDPAELQSFSSNEHYSAAIELLGYTHP